MDTLRSLILSSHDYARSLPDPRSWLTEQRQQYSRPAPERWRIHAQVGVRLWAQGWVDYARHCARESPENPSAQIAATTLAELAILPIPDPPGSPAISDPARLVTLLARLLRAGDKTTLDRRKATAWLKPFKKLFEETRTLHASLETLDDHPGSASALDQDWSWSREDVVALLDLVLHFDDAFSRARRSAAVVDFADLEQLALELLWNSDRQAPSALALALRHHLDLVFVDEYQDINGAQDRILHCLSRENEHANRFLVGDVKQSIYRFRRADPRIFQRYARTWRNSPHAAVLDLTENFRSHQAILDFVNPIFASLLREEAGGVAFDRDARLQLGAPDLRAAFREQPEGRIECHLFVTGQREASGESEAAETIDGGPEEPLGTESDADDLDAEEIQARITARRLRSFREESASVWDLSKQAHRPVQWRDMVVLHPAPRSASERWARAFAGEGVPLDTRRGGFFEAIEVSDLVSLVRLLDNPRQDLPLLAVLRSPLVGMTLDELATIRIVSPEASYWQALLNLTLASGLPSPTEVSSSNPSPHDPTFPTPEIRAAFASAKAKAAEFLDHFVQWRRLATQGSLAACLETILADTGYEAWILSSPRATAQRANLRRLLALSRQFDSLQRHGLFRFIQFIEAQSDAADSIESAPAASGDSVRLLSIHQSKGLEFPIVVVAGLGRRFNDDELRGDWLLDPDFGVCPPVLPPGHRRGYPSLLRWLAGNRQKRDRVGEQIRLLYVAFTRASERLLLVGTARQTRLAVWHDTPSPLPFRALLDAQTPLDWLGPLLPEIAGQPDLLSQDEGHTPTLTWRFHRTAPPSRPALTPRAASPTGPRFAEKTSQGMLELDFPESPDPALLAAARARLTWQYPWPDATLEPAKAAVTALRRQWLTDEETQDASRETPTAPPQPGTQPAHAHRLHAIERGLAHHTFNEHVALEQTTSEQALREEAERLHAAGWLSREILDGIDFPGLAGFWLSPFGQSLRDEPNSVHRELPFTLRLTPADAARLGSPRPIHGFADDDYQVVQGVVDLALVREHEIWIVDFKTDRVATAGVSAKAQEYAPQLRLYAHALTSIYQRPVTRTWLYFIATRDLVEIPRF